jgi:dihydrofolate reductase
MPNLTIIAAVSENGVIGREGHIPWYLPEDLKRFKTLTLGHPVIMGRKTYESILERIGRPLPDRKNIILTSGNLDSNGIYVAHSIPDALAFCGDEDSFIIGGREVYDRFLSFPDVNRMEITKIHKNIKGDVRFPMVNWEEWVETERDSHREYSFITYERR